MRRLPRLRQLPCRRQSCPRPLLQRLRLRLPTSRPRTSIPKSRRSSAKRRSSCWMHRRQRWLPGTIRRTTAHRSRRLRRPLHTLKGGARMAGIIAMGELAHELESLITRIESGLASGDESARQLAQQALDELSKMRDQIAEGRPVARVPALIAHIQAASGAGPRLAPMPELAAAAEPAAPPPSESSLAPGTDIAGVHWRRAWQRRSGGRCGRRRIRSRVRPSRASAPGRLPRRRPRRHRYASICSPHRTAPPSCHPRPRSRSRSSIAP